MGHPNELINAHGADNAAFIVRACNAHDDMLAALELAANTLKDIFNGFDTCPARHPGKAAYEAALAAIAKARED